MSHYTCPGCGKAVIQPWRFEADGSAYHTQCLPPVSDKPMSANAQQVGGLHYRNQAVQPWDFIARNGIGYLEGCAIKHLSRWRQKGGVDDLRKARHYIEKLIELETEGGA